MGNTGNFHSQIPWWCSSTTVIVLSLITNVMEIIQQLKLTSENCSPKTNQRHMKMQKFNSLHFQQNLDANRAECQATAFIFRDS